MASHVYLHGSQSAFRALDEHFLSLTKTKASKQTISTAGYIFRQYYPQMKPL
jgi:hypothetical protein